MTLQMGRTPSLQVSSFFALRFTQVRHDGQTWLIRKCFQEIFCIYCIC